MNWDDLYDDWMPMVAAGPDGRVWVVWQQSGPRGWEVFASVWEGSGWSYQQAVCPDDGIQESLADIAVGPDCMPWVIMERRTGGPPYLHTSRWSGAGWDPPEPLFPDMPDEREPLAPRIAVDSEGTPWVIWSSYVNEAYDSDLFYSRRVGGVWSPPEPVCTNSGPGVVNARDIVRDAFGNPWAVWSRSPPAPTYEDITVVTHWQESAWAIPDTVPGGGYGAAMGVHDEGDLWVVTHQGFAAVWASHRERGRWVPAEQVSTPDDQHSDGWPRIAITSDGTPWIVWQRHYGLTVSDREILSSARVHGRWLPEVRVSSADGLNDGTPDLCLTRAGEAWVVWQASDGSDDEILWSRSASTSGTPGSCSRSGPTLSYGWPNPATDIVHFELPSVPGSPQHITIHDSAGRLVRELSPSHSSSSPSSRSTLVIWDCTDLRNERVSQGSYVYRAQSEGRAYGGVLILLR